MTIISVLLAVIAITLIVFEVLMFLDLLANTKLGNNQKWLWGIAMFLLHPFVAIAYYLKVYSKRD